MILKNLIGVFINFLPIRLAPKKHLKLSEYLNNSQNTLLEAYNNQDYPFDLMVEDNIRQRDISRNPFFDTLLNFHLETNIHGDNQFDNENIRSTGISIRPRQFIQEDVFQSVLDFKLDIVPNNEKLDFYLSYNSKLFSEERMNKFFNHFFEFLEEAIREPDNLLENYGSWDKKMDGLKISSIPKSFESEFNVTICSSFVLEPVFGIH